MRLIKPLQVTEAGFVERESNAYYKGPTGLLQVAGPNVTRFYYNTDGNFAGFLLEPDTHQSRLLYSEDFSNDAFWAKENIAIGAAGEGPDGEATSATRLTASGTAKLTYRELAVAQTGFTLATGAPTTMRIIEFLPAADGDPLPYVQAVGALAANSGGSNINVIWPAHAVGDIGILVTEYSGTILAAPSGWSVLSAELNSSGTNQTQSIIYWRRADSISMGAAAFATSNDHKCALIFTLRGCKATGDPFAQVQTAVSATTDAGKTIPAFTAAAAHSLMVVVATYGNDAASNATSGWANASLGDFTVSVDGVGTALGNGGGIIVASAGFEAVGYLTGLTESKFRSSIFAKRVSGSDPVTLYNTRGTEQAQIDLATGGVVSGDAETEQYANGFWRITALKDTGFIASEYGFGLEFTGEILVFGANLTPGLTEVQYLLDDEPMTGDIIIESSAVNLIYSNIPEPDPDFLPEAGATIYDPELEHDLDDVVIFNHIRYISLVGGNADLPSVGAAKDVPTWVNAGSSNHWRMFDFMRGVDFKSERQDLIEVLIQVPGVARSFALFGLEANSVHVQAFSGDEQVYDETFNLVNVSAIANWYDYFSVVPTTTSSLVKFNLPPIPGLLVRISISQDGMVRVGKLVIGTEVQIGCAAWGFSSQLINTSRQERDAFGELLLVPRRVYRTRDFSLKYETSLAEHIESAIIDVVNTPTVFVGSEALPTSAVFGIPKEFTSIINGPKQSTASLRLEEI